MSEQPCLFELIAKLADRDGAAPLNRYDNCWVRRLDGHWVIAVNAHKEMQSCEPPECMRADVGPWECAVWFNGWLAGLFDPDGGLIAGGKLANEASFAAVLEEVLA